MSTRPSWRKRPRENAGRALKVLGIDPGSAVVGYGLVEDGQGSPRLLECGVIRADASESLPARLRTISEGVTELISRHRPDVLAIAERRVRIYEVGITYAGRTYAEGKKIGWRDGVAAISHIIRFNLFPPPGR